MPHLFFPRCITTLMLSAMLILTAQAHEMDGIDHAHLANGMVQIIEPIPGGQSASTVRAEKAETDVAPQSTQPAGIAALLIQAGLILSALVLMVVVLRAGTNAHRPQHKQTTDAPPHPSTPIPPG